MAVAGAAVGNPVAVPFRGKNMDKAKHTGRWLIFHKVQYKLPAMQAPDLNPQAIGAADENVYLVFHKIYVLREQTNPRTPAPPSLTTFPPYASASCFPRDYFYNYCCF